MISSPRPIPQPNIAASSAAVPVLCASAYRVPCHWANSASKAFVTPSCDMAPRLRTSRTARRSSLVMIGQVKRSRGLDRTALGPPKRASCDLTDFNLLLMSFS